MFLALARGQSAQVDATETIVGEQREIGNGTVRTWLKVDAKTGEPRSLGVTLTEQGLAGLPGDTAPAQQGSAKLRLMDGGPNHTFEDELKFPPEAADTAFNHMGFNWNAMGHGPKGIFTWPTSTCTFTWRRQNTATRSRWTCRMQTRPT